MKFFASIFLAIIFLSSACGTANKSQKTKRLPARVVPIAFNIETKGNSELNFINMNYYRLKILSELENFQNVDFTLVEPDENPELVLNLNINNFVLWERDERVSRRNLSRVVQTGTDANGKPVYQTVRASVDIVQVQRRSNASFVAEIKFKANPEKNFKRSYSPNYNYNNTYVDNIQGDQRAVDPSLYFSRNSGIEPDAQDFLFNLSGEVVQRVSSELRSYYSKQ